MIGCQTQWAPLQTQWHKNFYKHKKLLVIMEMVLVLFWKKDPFWALEDALNDDVVAMVSSHGYSTTTIGNAPRLGVSSKEI